MSVIKQNTIIYSVFLLITSIGLLYGNEIKNTYTGLRVWQLDDILLLGLGIPFLFLQKSASIPNFWDSSISCKQRLRQPIFIGGIFGILDIIVIKIIQNPEPYTVMPPFLQPFPYSILFYFSGAIAMEVFYRLIPLTLILLIGKKLKGGTYFNYFLWIGLIVTSIREPLEQLPSGEIWYVSYAFISGIWMNYLQGTFYIKAGFISTLTLRLGHYLFWHILLGIYVQYFEMVN